MQDKDYIYAFLHIPKTAGSTFRYHIIKHLKEEERLYLGAEDLGLWHPNKKPNTKDLKIAVDKKIGKLSKKEREKIRVVFGHDLTNDVDKYFDRPVRYFTFFRDPAKRTISLYNHYREQYLDFKEKGRPLENFDTNFLVDGKVPEFKEWLVNKYNRKGNDLFLTIYKRLKLNGFIDKDDDKEIDKFLGKMWFVGLVENFDEESLYLYDKLGVYAFFVNQNISEKHFKLSDNPKIENEIIKRNREDILIYNKAKKYNKKLLEKFDDFDETIEKMRVKKKIILPFTQTYYAPLDTIRIISRKLL